MATWEWHVPANEVVFSQEFYEILGIDPGDLECTVEGFLSLLHPDDRAAAEAALGRALDGTEPYALAHRLIGGDGRQRTMLCSGLVEFDLDGIPLRMAGASLDVTDEPAA